MNGIEEAKQTLEATIADGDEFAPRLLVLTADEYVAVMDIFPNGRPPDHVPVAIGTLYDMGGEGGYAVILTDSWYREFQPGEDKELPASGSLGDDVKSIDALVVIEVRAPDIKVSMFPYTKAVVDDRIAVTWLDDKAHDLPAEEGNMIEAIRAGLDSRFMTDVLTVEQRVAMACRFGHAIAVALPDFDPEAVAQYADVKVEHIHPEEDEA